MKRIYFLFVLLHPSFAYAQPASQPESQPVSQPASFPASEAVWAASSQPSTVSSSQPVFSETMPAAQDESHTPGSKGYTLSLAIAAAGMFGTVATNQALLNTPEQGLFGLTTFSDFEPRGQKILIAGAASNLSLSVGIAHAGLLRYRQTKKVGYLWLTTAAMAGDFIAQVALWNTRLGKHELYDPLYGATAISSLLVGSVVALKTLKESVVYSIEESERLTSTTFQPPTEMLDSAKRVRNISAAVAAMSTTTALISLSSESDFSSSDFYLLSASSAISHLSANSFVLSSTLLRYNQTKRVRTLYGAALLSSAIATSSVLLGGVAVAQSFVDEPSEKAVALGGAFFVAPSSIQTTFLLSGYAIKESINLRRDVPLNVRESLGNVCAFCVSSLREERNPLPLYTLSGIGAVGTLVSSVVALRSFFNIEDRLDDNFEKAFIASSVVPIFSSVALTSLAMARYRDTKKLKTLYTFTGAAAINLAAGILLPRAIVPDDSPLGNPLASGTSEAFFPSLAIQSIIVHKAVKNSFREMTKLRKDKEATPSN